jgi:hypothetical protein
MKSSNRFLATLIVTLTTLGLAFPAFASSAKIFAYDSDHKKTEVALDSKGTPRNNGDRKTYPTIKDFREGGDYVGFCYVGDQADVKALLTVLVEAADGDGDSYAELKSIRFAKTTVSVTAEITDESGKKPEVYQFKQCKS